MYVFFRTRNGFNNALCPQDRTHPPQYYNPIFDVKTDHGTVKSPCFIRVILQLDLHFHLLRQPESYIGGRQEWNGCRTDVYCEPRLWIAST